MKATDKSKLKKLGIGAAIVALGSLFLFKNKSDNNSQVAYKSQAQINAEHLESLAPQFQDFTIAFNKDTTLQLPNGTFIQIPNKAFISQNNSDSVQIQYREFKDPLDYITSGLKMTYDSAGTEYHFESAGMFEMYGYQNGKPITINPERNIQVSLQSSKTDNDFNIYYFDTVANQWNYINKDTSNTGFSNSNPKPLTQHQLSKLMEKANQIPSVVKLNDSLTKIDSLDRLNNKKLQVVVRKLDKSLITQNNKQLFSVKLNNNLCKESKLEKYAIKGSKTDSVITDFNTSLYATHGGDLQLTVCKKWQDEFITDIQQYFLSDTSENPKIRSALNFYIDQDYGNFDSSMIFKEFTKLSFKKRPDHTYVLHFSKEGEGYVDIHVEPVTLAQMQMKVQKLLNKRKKYYGKKKEELKTEINNLIGEIAKREQQAYNIRLAEIERQKEIARQNMLANMNKEIAAGDYTNFSIARIFTINNFGLWNTDRPKKLPDNMIVKAKFKDIESKQTIGSKCFYLVEVNENMMYTYYPNKLVRFGFNSRKNNLVWTVSNNNELYFTSNNNFKKASYMIPHTFEMQKVDKKFKSADEIREFFGI